MVDFRVRKKIGHLLGVLQSQFHVKEFDFSISFVRACRLSSNQLLTERKEKKQRIPIGNSKQFVQMNPKIKGTQSQCVNMAWFVDFHFGCRSSDQSARFQIFLSCFFLLLCFSCDVSASITVSACIDLCVCLVDLQCTT